MTDNFTILTRTTYPFLIAKLEELRDLSKLTNHCKSKIIRLVRHSIQPSSEIETSRHFNTDNLGPCHRVRFSYSAVTEIQMTEVHESIECIYTKMNKMKKEHFILFSQDSNPGSSNILTSTPEKATF
jgi:hypothetical protein